MIIQRNTKLIISEDIEQGNILSILEEKIPNVEKDSFLLKTNHKQLG